MSHDKLCIYNAANLDEANIVVAWLADHDIKALIPDLHTTATLGLPTLIPGGVDVCVADANQLAEATSLLDEHRDVIAKHVAAAGAGGTIEVICVTCDKPFDVERREAGHVVECPHCHEYNDVPDPSAATE